MLLADFGKPLRNADPKAEEREAVYRWFGKLQVEAVKQVDKLLGTGCLDRRLTHLIGQVDGLVEDPNIVDQLDDSEIRKLRELIPRLKEKIGELTTFRVPETLVHGDLHLGNIAGRDGSLLVFDWTDGCVTHPFFDMMGIYVQKHEELRSRFRNAYLDAWTEFESMNRLQRCWELAGSLYYLHHAISYQHITASLEAVSKPELDEASDFLRKLLNLEDWQ